MSFNRLYFYAVGEDYLDVVERIAELGLNVLPPDSNAPETNLMLPYGGSRDDFDNNSRLRYLSHKPMSEVRRARSPNNLFSEATYDVISWARGYIYKDQQLVGHMIKQTLPRFDKPNPSQLDLQQFEDAKALRKAISSLRRWMKKNWVDHYGDGDFFGPEALRLKLEEGYEDASLELDNIPPTIYILPKK